MAADLKHGENFWKVLTWVPMSLRAHLNQRPAESGRQEAADTACAVTAGHEPALGGQVAALEDPALPVRAAASVRGPQQKVAVGVSLGGIEEVADKSQS